MKTIDDTVDERDRDTVERVVVAADCYVDDGERTTVDPPPALRRQFEAEADRHVGAGIEVVIVARDAVPRPGAPWHYVQLWTRQHIYAVDLTMVCVAVYERATGAPDKQNRMLGGHLTGGQRVDGGTVKMVYPLPVPGTHAVFELRNARGHTSNLERVLVRLPAMTVAEKGAKQTWESIVSWEDQARRKDKVDPR